MNQINGYCQINIPKSLLIETITSKETELNKDIRNAILSGLGLNKIPYMPYGDKLRHAILERLALKPVYVSYYHNASTTIPTIVNALVVDLIDGGDAIDIVFPAFYDSESQLRSIKISMDISTVNPDSPYFDTEMYIFAKNLTQSDVQ